MYKRIFKRLLDLLVSLVALPVLFILVLIIGPIIYFQDRGPIFYTAQRLGKNGTIFMMYKFRSMHLNAPDIRNKDGSTFNSEKDTRVTKVGKFLRKTSLDETPQLLNIIKGEMSIIGPRPDLLEHQKLYIGEEKRKLEIKPGLTGYNQAYFRNSVNWKDRLRNDIYYIDHLSFWFDIKILVKTIKTVLKREAVYTTENNDKDI